LGAVGANRHGATFLVALVGGATSWTAPCAKRIGDHLEFIFSPVDEPIPTKDRPANELLIDGTQGIPGCRVTVQGATGD
jgi:hypothetical protein